jgi:hypothetical protein
MVVQLKGKIIWESLTIPSYGLVKRFDGHRVEISQVLCWLSIIFCPRRRNMCFWIRSLGITARDLFR